MVIAVVAFFALWQHGAALLWRCGGRRLRQRRRQWGALMFSSWVPVDPDTGEQRRSQVSEPVTELAEVSNLSDAVRLEFIAELHRLMAHAAHCKSVRHMRAESGPHAAEFLRADEALKTTEQSIKKFLVKCTPRETTKTRSNYRGAPFGMSRPRKRYLFASGPEYDTNDEPVLLLASTFIEAAGFANVAGDAKDQFHQQVMTKDEMDVQLRGWRLAWKGKVATGIDMTTKHYPGLAVELITIDGGPECQWEVQEIQEHIIPAFQNAGVEIELKACRNWEEFVRYMMDFERPMPQVA